MILTATIRHRPAADAKNVADLPTRRIIAEGDTYDTAKTGLEEQVPNGWHMLLVRPQQ